MWPIRAVREPKTTGAGLKNKERSSSSQRQLPQTLVQAAQEVDSYDPPGPRECLRQAVQYIRPLARAPPRPSGFAGAAGIESGATQLLYLAQRPARSPSSELRGSNGMVSSRFTPSVLGGERDTEHVVYFSFLRPPSTA